MNRAESNLKRRAGANVSTVLLVTLGAAATFTGFGATMVPVTEQEARRLVLLVPEVREEAQRGHDAKCLLATSSGYNQRDYWFFTCFGPEDIAASSDKIGTYGVSRVTADVWRFVGDAPIDDPILQLEIESIRQSHHIPAELVPQYRDRPLTGRETSASGCDVPAHAPH